jgi:hypothetical protein
MRELAEAGEVIGVDVGIGGGNNGQVAAFGDMYIPIDIALGVDDQGASRLPAADEVSVLRKFGVCNLFQYHV